MSRPRSLTALYCLAAVLAGCTSSTSEDYVDGFSVSLDGGPALKGSLEWGCRVKTDHSLGFGPSHFIDAGGPYTRTFAMFPDGRAVLLAPRKFPIDTEHYKCHGGPLAEWEGYVLDGRGKVSILHHLPAGKYLEGMPSLSVQPRKLEAGDGGRNPQLDDAAEQIFLKKLGRMTRLALEENTYFREDGVPLPAHVLDANWLLALPKDRPTVLLPGRIADEPLRSDSSTDVDWQYKGLTEDLRGGTWMAVGMLPAADGAVVALDLKAMEARTARRPPGGPRDFRSWLVGDFHAPLVRIPGVDRPVRVAPSVAVWYPDQRRLIRIVWSDETQEMRRDMKLAP